MKRTYLSLSAGLVALIFCPAMVGATKDPQDIFGIYDAVGSHRGTMEVKLEGDRMRVELKGGASTRSSAPIAGDCEAVAEGVFDSGVLKAKLIPFEGELMSLDSADIARMRNDVLIRFAGDVADVEGAFSHCGLGNALYGKYKRRSLGAKGAGRR